MSIFKHIFKTKVPTPHWIDEYFRLSRGFTLMEVLITLLFMGILLSIAAMGITSGLSVYRISKDNTELSSKTAIALMRLKLELTPLTDIVTIHTNSFYLIYDTIDDRRAIARVDNTLKLYRLKANQVTLSDDELSNQGAVLIDQVKGFEMRFIDPSDNDPADGLKTFTVGMEMERLVAIQSTLSLYPAFDPNRSLTFTLTIHPRNTGSSGGFIL